MGKLCPESQLLSVYYDGELPSPWKEKLESHLADCPDCKQRLESYRRVSQEVTRPNAAALDEARERVWQRLELSTAKADSFRRSFPPSLWRRRISVPLPAAVAAVALLALTFFWVRSRPATSGIPAMTLAAEANIDTPEVIPVSDMESVLQYLNSRDSGEMVIIRLPESRNFQSYSEPAMIRAVDYQRNVQQGRRRH